MIDEAPSRKKSYPVLAWLVACASSRREAESLRLISVIPSASKDVGKNKAAALDAMFRPFQGNQRKDARPVRTHPHNSNFFISPPVPGGGRSDPRSRWPLSWNPIRPAARHRRSGEIDLVLCQTLDFGWPGKGVRHQKPERPFGCFALLVSDPFSRPRFNPIFKF